VTKLDSVDIRVEHIQITFELCDLKTIDWSKVETYICRPRWRLQFFLQRIRLVVWCLEIMFPLFKSLLTHLVTFHVVRYVWLHKSIFIDGFVSWLVLSEDKVRLRTPHLFHNFIALLQLLSLVCRVSRISGLIGVGVWRIESVAFSEREITSLKSLCKLGSKLFTVWLIVAS
jgi:hypothetical protein